MLTRQIILSIGFLFLVIAQVFGSEGEWGVNGTMVCSAGGEQSTPAVAVDNKDSAIIVWQDNSETDRIYAQKLDSGGNTQWAASGLVVCNAGGDQSYPAIAADSEGSAIIVWQDNSETDRIYAQKLDSGGNTQWAAGGLMVCNAGGDQWCPAIALDNEGSAIIVWQQDNSGTDRIYAQKLDSVGNTQWAAGGLVVCNAGGEQNRPAIAADSEGSAIIVWQQDNSGTDRIYTQKLNSEGGPQWTASGIMVCNIGDDQRMPEIDADSEGSAIIVWQDNSATKQIYAQKLDSVGNPQWADGIMVSGNSMFPYEPDIAVDSGNNAVVVWPNSVGTEISGQKLDEYGSKLWSENGITICSAGTSHKYSAIGTNREKSEVIVWSDNRTGPLRIFAQKFVRLKPVITSLSPNLGAWGSLTRNITIGGLNFQDKRGEITYVKLTPTAGTGQDIVGLNLRNISATSLVCDFDMGSVSGESSWYVVLYDSIGHTGTSASILFSTGPPEMQSLGWTSAGAGNLNTGTQNNLVGQINCEAYGHDFLENLVVKNLGTAEAGEDIPGLSLWHGPGGGSSTGITFYSLTPANLGSFNRLGAREWGISFGDEDIRIEDGDALYLTLDIAGGAHIGRTCRFHLPLQGAGFKYGNDLPDSNLVSVTEQIIATSASFKVEFISLMPVNMSEGQPGVRLGEIKIRNATGSQLEIESIVISLRDKAGMEQGLGAAFNKLWLEQGAVRVAELSAPFTENRFTLAAPVFLGAQEAAALELAGNVKLNPQVRIFFIGLADGQCLNNGKHLTDPLPGQIFPLLSGQANIRERDMKKVFSSYPNPFLPSQGLMRISYYLRSEARVKLKLVTFSGEVVKQVDEGSKSGGMHEALWDGRNARGYSVRSGVYLLRMSVIYADGAREQLTRKVAVAR